MKYMVIEAYETEFTNPINVTKNEKTEKWSTIWK